MPRPDLDELLDLIGFVYESALTPAGWRPLLERITRALDATAASFFVHDVAGRSEFTAYWGLPDDAMDVYVRDFAAIDVARDAQLARPPGTIITDESLPPEIFRRSEILNEFRLPRDIPHFVGYDLRRDARRFAALAVQGSGRRGPFGAPDAALLAQLLPHLRRAVAMSVRLESSDALRRGLEDAIEGLVVGVVLVGAGGDVLYANAAARRIVARRDGLAITAGRLRAHAAPDDRALTAAIGRAIATSRRERLEGGGSLAVQRAWGAPPYAVLVNPGPGRAADAPFGVASAIVLIGDPEAEIVSAEALAARLYRLTPSEARLAVALASGHSLESYAAERDTALSTARWTLKQVLAKTGARRQADLVRVLLTSPVATRLRPPEPGDDEPG